MSKTLPVGIQVYGLRDFLENTPENFQKCNAAGKGPWV